MVLKAIHDTLDEIPEVYRDLYTQKGEQFELTGVGGIKTQNDVDNMVRARDHEKSEHEKTKVLLNVWGDLKHDEVQSQLDRMPELEAASKGKLDEAEIEAIVTRRVDGTIKSKLASPERRIRELEKENGELKEVNGKLTETARIRGIDDALDIALVKTKVIDDAREDAKFQGRHIFEKRADDGAIVTKDLVGVTPGLDPEAWLLEVQPRKRHWWGESVGGGSRGSGATTPFTGKNPFSHEHWNRTAQAAIHSDKGPEYAKQMASAAGTTVGGKKPEPKKTG